jgi:hypothetical protein
MRLIKYAAYGDPKELREVEIHEERGGLAIQHYLDEWSITHVRSGVRAGSWRGTKKEARQRMRVLLRCGVDWTKPAAELMKPRSRTMSLVAKAFGTKPKRNRANADTPNGWEDLNTLEPK